MSGGASMRRRSFRDSIKLLEADIQHANTLSVVILFYFIPVIFVFVFGVIWCIVVYAFTLFGISEY